MSRERRTAADNPNVDRAGWSTVMIPSWAATDEDDPDDEL